MLGNSTSGKVKPSPQHALVGKRTKRGSIDPQRILSQAAERVESIGSMAPVKYESLKSLKQFFAEDCRIYYTVAAVSRRRVLETELRSSLLSVLFPLRSALESAIASHFPLISDQRSLWRDACGKSFFGVSSKQGVSVRYGLSSCVPTKSCGGRCYGHDGRDRELHILFRAVLNQYVGLFYENSSASHRDRVLMQLSKAIDYGIESARADANAAFAETGFKRRPRIRLSHIGEMAHTPEFTNALVTEISSRAPDVDCVIYTRHPSAKHLDADKLVVNFTIEGSNDNRRKYAPEGSRLVNSSWGGVLATDASVNFLEHHVEKTVSPRGQGFVCPVTQNHKQIPSCDSARCDICFKVT